MANFEKILNAQLRERANPLIKLYKRRAADKKYYDRVRLCMAKLVNASECLNSAAKALFFSDLNSEHTKSINLVLRTTSSVALDLSQFESKLSELSRECLGVSRTIKTFTAASVTKHRGRPAINYVSETQALMRVYEDVTGKRVVSPKGADKVSGEAHQFSTEFIRLCLHDIDAAIDTGAAMTLIKNALKQDAKVNELLEKLRPKNKAKAGEKQRRPTILISRAKRHSSQEK